MAPEPTACDAAAERAPRARRGRRLARLAWLTRHALWLLLVALLAPSGLGLGWRGGIGCNRGSNSGAPASAAASTSSSAAAAGASAPSASTALAASGSSSSALGADAGLGPADAEPSTPFARSEPVDVWIRGGTVIDGSGRPGRLADVVVQADRIVHVGAVAPGLSARQQIDATGLTVAPGFVDAHSHGDALDDNESFAAQGVTTLCIGQDGESPSGDRIRDWSRRVGKRKLRLNVAPLVGHGTVRSLSGIGGSKNPTPKQLEKMAHLVARELDAGAFGLSTGLEYAPGRAAGLDELAAIAKPVGEHDGVVMSHMRSEDDDQIDAALDELCEQGARSGARVHVSHIKVVYGHGAARAEQLLARMQAARDRGVRVSADIYPYEASYTTIGIVFPDFAKSSRSIKKLAASRRTELADYLRKRIALRNGPEATLFGTGPWRGKTLAELAKAANKPFEDVLIDDIGPDGASAAFFVMDDALQSRLLVDPHIAFSTDGRPTSRHPRAYGSFARVIEEYVRKRSVLSLEEAVHKASGLAAETIGLDRTEPKRGLLRAGYAADVVVFDPAKVRARASYDEPNLTSQGFDWVLVNGQPIREHGERTSARPGKVLLRR
jgi:N-acyl-D-amino-acid deacylase